MSSELLEDCWTDNGEAVGLSMNDYSYALLTVYEVEQHGASFELSPDEKGFENARKIIAALEAWMDHVKDINK